jgi:hypothetical protein
MDLLCFLFAVGATFVLGIIALVNGRIKLSPRRTVEGASAGIVLICAIPLAVLLAVLGGGNVGWVVWAIAAVIALVVGGWNSGPALGYKQTPPPPRAWRSRPPPSVPPPEPLINPSVSPPADLILRPEEVEDKARKTTRLLEALANHDAAFSPAELRAYITATFTRVQQCWEARDYSPVRGLLGPSILAQHEELVRAMRRDRVINRIQDVRLQRLEFVLVWCPPEADRHEVTALITWEAKVYFVDDRSGAFLRGSQKAIPYQEFWVFRRHGAAWRLQSIERSHASGRLEVANHVDGMTEVDQRNAENGVIVL